MQRKDAPELLPLEPSEIFNKAEVEALERAGNITIRGADHMRLDTAADAWLLPGEELNFSSADKASIKNLLSSARKLSLLLTQKARLITDVHYTISNEHTGFSPKKLALLIDQAHRLFNS